MPKKSASARLLLFFKINKTHQKSLFSFKNKSKTVISPSLPDFENSNLGLKKKLATFVLATTQVA